MTDLRRTPTLQHAVTLMRPTVAETVREMEKLDEAIIPFSLSPGRRMFKALMEGQSLDWVVGQLQLDKRAKNIKPNVALVEAFEPYAKSKTISWFRECQTDGYPIGGGVIIPVRPAGYWVEAGQLHVLWPQCWKGRTLDPLQRAIFNTILHQKFFVGDFKDAVLEFVDLREQVPRKGRDIEVHNAEQLGFISQDELIEHLQVLLTAFQEHSVKRDARKAEEKARKKPKDTGPTLFEF
jgi:hypothetical protein